MFALALGVFWAKKKYKTFTFHWLCFEKKLLGVPETWLCRFAGRPSHASPTPLEDGPPPQWIHLLPGFWILCEDLDHSRNRQAQPTHWEWKDDFQVRMDNAELLAILGVPLTFLLSRLDVLQYLKFLVMKPRKLCWNMHYAMQLCSWSTSIELLNPTVTFQQCSSTF